jgi:hypothetical protein
MKADVAQTPAVGQAPRLPGSPAGAPPVWHCGRGARGHDPAGGAPAPLPCSR